MVSFSSDIRTSVKPFGFFSVDPAAGGCAGKMLACCKIIIARLLSAFAVFEALLQPSEVCPVALGVLSVAVRRAAETVVTTGYVHRYGRTAASGPTDVLAVFLKNGVRALALVNQGHRAPAEALFARKEDFAHMRKPFQRVATFNPLLLVAVGPFVVARSIDKRVCRSAKLREPASHQVIGAGIWRRRQVAHVNHKRQLVPVQVVKQVLKQWLLGRTIAEIADQAKCEYRSLA